MNREPLEICNYKEDTFYSIKIEDITDFKFYETMDVSNRYTIRFFKNNEYDVPFYYNSPLYFSTIEELEKALLKIRDDFGVNLSTNYASLKIKELYDNINTIRIKYNYYE